MCSKLRQMLTKSPFTIIPRRKGILIKYNYSCNQTPQMQSVIVVKKKHSPEQKLLLSAERKQG